MRYALIILIAYTTSAVADEQEVTAVGSHIYGPDLSKNEGCGLAKKKAKIRAMAKVSGETMSSEERQTCTEQGSNSDCIFNRLMMTETEGRFISQEVINRTTKPTQLADHMKCTVTMRVSIDAGIGKPDPNFDFEPKLSQQVFVEGDRLNFTLNTTAPMYVAIFLWKPSPKNDVLKKIFPNKFDNDHFFANSGKVSIPKNVDQYAFQVSVDDIQSKKSFVAEHIKFIATKKKINFLSEYSHDKLQKKLMEIPRNMRRTKTRSYTISLR